MMEQLAERRMQREEEAALSVEEDDSEEDDEDDEDEDGDDEDDEDEDEDDEVRFEISSFRFVAFFARLTSTFPFRFSG